LTHESRVIPVISSSNATNEHVLNFSAKTLSCSSKFFVVTDTILNMHEFLCPKFDYLDYFHVFISQHLRNYKTNTYCNLISSAVQLNPRILSFAHSHLHAGNTDSRVKVASHRKRLAAQQTNKTRRGVCCIVSNALRWVGGRCCGATCFDALRLPVPRSISMACGREASFWIFGARGPRPKSNGKLKPATQNRVHNFLKIPWHGTLSCEP
jgi:hypothetical protein